MHDGQLTIWWTAVPLLTRLPTPKDSRVGGGNWFAWSEDSDGQSKYDHLRPLRDWLSHSAGYDCDGSCHRCGDEKYVTLPYR